MRKKNWQAKEAEQESGGEKGLTFSFTIIINNIYFNKQACSVQIVRNSDLFLSLCFMNSLTILVMNNASNTVISLISKIQLVVCYQCCVLIG